MPNWTYEGVDYIVVELVNKAKMINGVSSIVAEQDVVRGLFAGLKLIPGNSKEKSKYFCLVKKGNNYEMLNMNLWLILSIEKLAKSVKRLLLFRMHEEDQKVATEVLFEAVTSFVEQQLIIPNTLIIDTTKYKNPSAAGEGNYKYQNPSAAGEGNYKFANTKPASINIDYININTANSTSTTYNGVSSPAITVIKRKSKKPSTKDLTNMMELVTLLAKGEYKAPAIPIIKEKENNETVVDYNPYIRDAAFENEYCC